MKKSIFITSIFALLFAKNSVASLTFDGQNVTTNLSRGYTFTSGSGTWNNAAGGTFLLTLTPNTQSSCPTCTIAGFSVFIDGILRIDQEHFEAFSGNHNFLVYLQAGSQATCNSTQSYTIDIKNSNGQTIDQGSGTVKVVGTTLSASDICGLNTNATFTVNPSGSVSNPSYSWQILCSGWKINGTSTPATVYTSGTSATITSPGSTGSCTLTAGGSGFCSNISQTINVSNGVPGTPTSITRILAVNGNCPGYKGQCTAVSGAVSYTWYENSSCTGSSYTTTSNQSNTYFACVDGPTIYLCVKAHNACGYGGTKTGSIGIPCPNTCPNKMASDQNSNEAVILFPNPASNQVFINGGEEVGNATINIVNSVGEVLLSVQGNAQGAYFNTDRYAPGLYFVIINGETLHKVLKLQIQR